jgi:hypothetical protein
MRSIVEILRLISKALKYLQTLISGQGRRAIPRRFLIPRRAAGGGDFARAAMLLGLAPLQILSQRGGQPVAPPLLPNFPSMVRRHRVPELSRTWLDRPP